MIAENLSTLKIHKLTKEQYERELAAGRIDEYALYLTQDEEIDYTIFATVDQLDGKADSEHTHSVEDVEDFQQKIDETLAASKSYTDGLISGKADENHNHDDKYYTEGEIDSKLSTINSSITDITSGTIAVKEAEHSETATKATQDASGNVIVDTYETKTDAVSKLDEAKSYTDTAIANLVNSAPETMDTLGELATAMNENKDVVDALDQAITNKADKDHTHSWNDLEDKPFGDVECYGDTLTFDGNTEGKVSINGVFFKVSDKVITYDDLVNGFSCFVNGGTFDGTQDTVTDIDGVVRHNDLLFCSVPESAVGKNIDGIVMEESGTYFVWSDEYNLFVSSLTINGYNGFKTIETNKLDEKFIPDTIARVEDVKQVDWNQTNETAVDYIKNRPFSEAEYSDTLTWDGNTEGRYCLFGEFYKVSDTVITYDDIVNGVSLVRNEYSHGLGQNEIAIQNDIMVFEFKCVLSVPDSVVGKEINGEIVQESGTYFAWTDLVHVTDMCVHGNNIFKVTDLKQLDEKFIPETIARVSDLPQPDWNQNDETASDYIKNRTHYIDGNVEVIAEIPLSTRNSYNAGNSSYIVDGLDVSTLDINENYSLVVEGCGSIVLHKEIYNNKLDGFKNVSTGDEITIAGIVFRDITLDTFINGTFLVMYSHSVVESDSLAGFTAKLVKGEEVVHQLDEKFIPDTIVRVDQGVENADKILTTNAEGKVVTELAAWTMSNVIETLADTDLINILKVHDDSMLADADGNVLSF